MKQFFLLSAFICFSLALSAQQRPNIIVFLVDDMGWQDCSLPFWKEKTPLNKTYHTPNMERLAAEGVKFTNAYAAPVCTPSRTAMLTGMSPAHLGITSWTSTSKNDNTDAADKQFDAANWNINGLSPVPGIERTACATAFPQILKDAGYYTIHVGKAHWASAGTPGANPHNFGFMINIAGHAGGHPQNYLGEKNYGNPPAQVAQPQAVPDMEEYYGTNTFLTEALTLEALKAIEEPIKRKQPFYLNMAHYAVHMPIMSDDRFIQKYLDAGMDSLEAAYATLIEGMDKSLGDIMDYLKKNGVEKNTVIIFMSDNGGLSLVPPRHGKPHTQNLPLKAGKGSVYEGGIREPMIVKYPGMVKAGATASQYVIIEDFFPTILELAGIKNYKTFQQLDGRSFVPILKNPGWKDGTRDLVWHSPNKWQAADGPGINYRSAIRKGDWKLVYNMRNGSAELYNVANDIGEMNDVAKQNPDKTRELLDLLGLRLKNWKAPMPIDKATNKPVAWPGITTAK